jgi:hypothetical protein
MNQGGERKGWKKNNKAIYFHTLSRIISLDLYDFMIEEELDKAKFQADPSTKK